MLTRILVVQLNNWEDTSLDEMKVFVAHLIVMGILKKNSLEQYWSRDSILNMPFLTTTCPEIIFKTSCGIFTSVIQMRPIHRREKGNHDPLFLVRPMVDMMQRKFPYKVQARKRNFLLMKATCPFKGRVHFKCYSPKKTKQVPY